MIILVASCQGNGDKLRLGGPPGLSKNFILLVLNIQLYLGFRVLSENEEARILNPGFLQSK